MVDTYEAYVWEPALVKSNALAAATEAACLVLSVDETVRMSLLYAVPFRTGTLLC